jgi:hypothetical protein
MYYGKEVTSYLQANKILALKLDHSVAGVRDAVSNQIETISAGAQRALYYTSCFTDDYQEVCQRQKIEDMRFRNSVLYLLRHGNVVYDMLKIYFEEIFKFKTNEQLENIKLMLMAVNVHISASSLTGHGFSLATAAAVAAGTNLSLNMSALAGRASGLGVTVIGIYGIVQKAADSANNLRLTYPTYYAALYAHELEMMYFLIEPTLKQSGALMAQRASDRDIADIIANMIR